MIFLDLTLSREGVVSATATGHPNEVMTEFHRVASLLLGSRGRWRITGVSGVAPLEIELDSDMRWQLTAQVKDRGI